MKTAFFLFFLILFLPVLKANPDDFDYQISNIVKQFKDEIMDKDECKKQKDNILDLIDEMKAKIKKEEYSSEELSEVKQLLKEAEAIERFISLVGDFNNFLLSLDDLHLANKRIRASISNMVKYNDYCIGILSLEINDFVMFLGENKTSKNYKVTYKWEAPNRMNSGNGTMGLTKMSVRPIFNNREKLDLKNINIYSVTCAEF